MPDSPDKETPDAIIAEMYAKWPWTAVPSNGGYPARLASSLSREREGQHYDAFQSTINELMIEREDTRAELVKLAEEMERQYNTRKAEHPNWRDDFTPKWAAELRRICGEVKRGE